MVHVHYLHLSYSVYYSDIFSTVELLMFENVDGHAKNIV